MILEKLNKKVNPKKTYIYPPGYWKLTRSLGKSWEQGVSMDWREGEMEREKGEGEDWESSGEWDN